MAFDPNQPFEIEEDSFDPSKPFTLEKEESSSVIPQAQAATLPQAQAPVQGQAQAQPQQELPIEQLRTQKMTVPEFWDNESQVKGLAQPDEDEYIRMLNDRNVSVEDINKYLSAKGFSVNPKDITDARESSAKSGLPIGVGGYERAPVTVDKPQDGVTGAASRGFGSGVLSGGLDELGAVVDTLGGTDNRENIFNSDRRFTDIWADTNGFRYWLPLKPTFPLLRLETGYCCHFNHHQKKNLH